MLALGLRRWRWSRRSDPAEALQRCWREPFPAAGARVGSLSFLVCDAEMSGLDPRQAELLSLGWVRVENLETDLGSARHVLIRNQRSVGQSATVHRLRDCELSEAGSARDALISLLEQAVGSVLVFHNAALDMAFLNRAAKRDLGAPLLMPVVDTLQMEHRLLRRRERGILPGELRLQACRERYGLPAHAAHNALDDALATAELFMAHCARRGTGLRLRDLLA